MNFNLRYERASNARETHPEIVARRAEKHRLHVSQELIIRMKMTRICRSSTSFLN